MLRAWCDATALPSLQQVRCLCPAGDCPPSAVLHALTDEQWRVVAARCTADAHTNVRDTRWICQFHYDRWLHRYRPQQCAVCQQPLSSSALACPEWLREQLHAHTGSFMHKRPCYEQALGQRKQNAAAETVSSELMDAPPDEPMQPAENHPPTRNTNDSQEFKIDVSGLQSTSESNIVHVHATHCLSLALLQLPIDSSGGGHSPIPGSQVAVALPTQTQSRCSRHHCYSADDNPWGASVARHHRTARY